MNPQLFTPLTSKEKEAEILNVKRITYWQRVWLRCRINPLAMTGLCFLGALTLFAFIGPYFSAHTYYETHLALKNTPPSSAFWFGTDDLGRDMFARMSLGARISLFVGIAAALIDLLIGVLYGGIAALFGGWVDQVMMRIADILYALPYLLVVILLMVVMGSGLFPILIALTITGWISMARIVRGQILSLRERDYILAARSLGASHRRVLISHLLPNTLGPIIVTVTMTIPMAIFVEAFLSFLGLGVQAPIASWGTMASDGLPALRYYPWRLFFPAAFISLTMLAFNLVGDGLRDALDPKLQGES
jgi:oligopeptide transport system permease protein